MEITSVIMVLYVKKLVILLHHWSVHRKSREIERAKSEHSVRALILERLVYKKLCGKTYVASMADIEDKDDLLSDDESTPPAANKEILSCLTSLNVCHEHFAPTISFRHTNGRNLP